MSVDQTQPYGVPGDPGHDHFPSVTAGEVLSHEPRVRSRRRAGGPRFRWVSMLFTALTLAILVGIGGTLFYIDRSFAGRIYPNVAIRGVSVGQLSPEEARRTLEERFASFLAQPVTLNYGDRSWTPTLAELGVQLEIDAAIDEAYRAGRDNGLIENIRQVAAVWQHGLELPLRMTIDQEAMQAYLLQQVQLVDQPAVDARLELDGTLISIQPGSPGQQVLVGETLQEITASVQELSPQTVLLRTRELQPRLNDSAATAAQAEIGRILVGPITLNVGAEQFIWPLDDLARLIRVERTSENGNDRLLVSVDQELVKAKINALADATEVRGALPRLAWNGGDLRITQPGTPGERINENITLDQVFGALNAPAALRTLDLSFREIPPPVTEANLAQLGIDDLIGVGRSDFSGSAAYRITNINAGMRQLDGILIPPGEEFSFNKTVGAIDSSNGFVEGYAIVQNRTQLEWGGGICQDSTTVFRAAFWAGLPITERWGHSFYISWYDRYGFGAYGDGPGMDATIYSPNGPDLKFLNDTGHWILMAPAPAEQQPRFGFTAAMMDAK